MCETIIPFVHHVFEVHAVVAIRSISPPHLARPPGSVAACHLRAPIEDHFKTTIHTLTHNCASTVVHAQHMQPEQNSRRPGEGGFIEG